MDRIALTWNGPYSWFGDGAPSLFKSADASTCGLYVWSAAVRDGDWVYYVGQTTKAFGERHWEHWREYASGAYGYHDPDAFYAGRHARVYSGFAYRRPAYLRTAPFFDSIDAHLTEVVRFLRPMRLWLAPCLPDRRLQRRIESALIQALYQQPGPARAFQEPGMRTELRRPDEAPVTVEMQGSGAFVGLANSFEA